MKAELVNGNIQLEASGVPAPTIRQVPGGQYSSELKKWIFPLSWALCVQLRAALGDQLEIGPELSRWAQEERARRVDPATTARTETDGPEPQSAEVVRTGGDYELEPADAVVAEDKWWYELWQGMPEFLQRDLSPWKTLKVHFRSAHDLLAFEELIGQRVTFKTPNIWFPEALHIIENDWRWVEEGQEDPIDAPIGRPSRRDENGKVVRGKPKSKAKAKDRGLDAILKGVGA